jgi:WD40 repeat protein
VDAGAAGGAETVDTPPGAAADQLPRDEVEQGPGPDPKPVESPQRPSSRRAIPVLLALVVIFGLFGAIYAGAVFLAEELAPGHVYAMAFSPDESRLVSAGPDRELRLWDLTDGATPASAEIDLGVRAVAWSPDSSTLALAVRDRIQLHRMPDLQQTATIPVGSDTILALCIGPDASTMYSLTRHFGLEVWDLKLGRRLGGIPEIPRRTLSHAGFSGDCGRIVTMERSGNNEVLAVFQRINMETIIRIPFRAMYDEPRLVGLNSNGATAVGIETSRIRTWNTANGKLRKQHNLSYLHPTALALGAKNRRFAVGGGRGQINIYDGNGNNSRSLQHGSSIGLTLLPLLE